MTTFWKKFLRRWDVQALAVLAIYPLFHALAGNTLPDWMPQGYEISTLFVFAILALGLNVAVGYTGLLQLGIAAFFGIGVYITGILTIPSNPFQIGFTASLVLSTGGAALFGLILGAQPCGCAAIIWRSSRSVLARW